MCKLTVDIFTDRVFNYIGQYYVKLGGNVDALVFAGGIGEKGSAFRKRVIEGAACLGFILDGEANGSPKDQVVCDISTSQSKHCVMICQTDEQVIMQIPSTSPQLTS